MEFCQPEVGYYGSSLVHEDVGGFQVSVGHSFFPHVLQTIPDVQDNSAYLLLSEACSLLDAVIQVTLPA